MNRRQNKSLRESYNVRVKLPLALVGFRGLAHPSTFQRWLHLANSFNRLVRKRWQSVAKFGRRRLSRDLSFTVFLQVGCDLRRRLLLPILHCKSG